MKICFVFGSPILLRYRHNNTSCAVIQNTDTMEQSKVTKDDTLYGP